MTTHEQYEQEMLKNGSKIAIIVTGGLIIEDGIKKTNSDELLDLIKPEINSKIIELVEFSVVDSSTIDLEFQHSLAKVVQRKINSQNIIGIVILHGTDTLEISSYFLYRCIYAHNKPIVITGSMRIISNSDYDGRANIINSIKQVLNQECRTYAGIVIESKITAKCIFF